MAQTGYTPISLYYSTTAAATPSAVNLANGELAINITDGKLYYKDNGGVVQLIASKAGASGDVVGPASATDNAIVRFDGATGKLVQNSVVTIADSTGDISGVGQLNATTVDTTNVEVTNIKAKDGTAAATIADSTGVVSITANPVLSGGTANGVLYLNGSKAATSGSALTFDGTSVLTIARASGIGNTQITLTNNGAGASGFQFGQSAQVQQFFIYDSGANKDRYIINSSGEHLWYGSSEQMRLTSTGLGIGTSSPSQKLTVAVADAAQSTSFQATTGRIRFRPYVDATNGAIIDATNTAESAYQPLTLYGSTLRLLGGGGVGAVVDSSGNLGLGVTPSAWGSGRIAIDMGANAYVGGTSLSHFTNNVFFDGTNFKYKTTAATGMYQISGADHIWFSAPSGTAGNAITFSQVMTLDASGNLMLGATSVPTSTIKLYTSDGTINAIQSYKTGGVEYIGTYSNHPLAILTNNAERARITSGGDLLVGDTTASARVWAYKTDDGNVLGARATNASYSATVGFFGADRNTTNNSFYYIDCYNYGATAYKFRVADSGDVTNTNNSYAGISDLKLKQDIVDASSQWDDIKNLRVRKYRLKSDPSMPLQIGLVAQEAELVSPGLVDEHTDRDAENNDLGTKTKSVKYSILYMKAIKALQEAMARIETLEAKVAQLEGTQP